ncbi:MAG: hypothetical protein KF819_14990 [Labilithrix sp.]|nr:hypothetical protein [Labilithrix sp.]
MRWTFPLLLALATVPAAGCFVETRETRPFPTPVAGDGTVTVRWSINSKFDRDQCSQGSVEHLRIRIFFLGGGLQGEYQAPCVDFATTVTLPAGTYTGEATLQGRAGARTTTVTLGQLTVSANQNTLSEIDFPASSFF